MVILNAIAKDDRIKADKLIKGLAGDGEDILKFGRYLLGNWESIRNLILLDIPGSCTEGQVSHVLSERFSRNPMGWSKEGLGKLSKLRVYRINGGKLSGKELKKKVAESYSEYAERFISERIEGATDWSIFEIDKPIMNGSFGTQALIRAYGADHGVLGRNILS